MRDLSSNYLCTNHLQEIWKEHGKQPGVYLWSDIHVDYQANWQFLNDLHSEYYKGDTLILAGDITDHLDRLQKVFEILLPKFKSIFFIPGNHELWVRANQNLDSIDKFHSVMNLAKSCGIKTSPDIVNIEGEDGSKSVYLIPLFSWYDSSLFLDVEGLSYSTEGWSDNYFCKWPSHLIEKKGESASFNITKFFLAMNDASLIEYNSPVITFSHFYSNKEQFKTLRNHNQAKKSKPIFNFSAVAGSEMLQTQIDKLNPRVHCFGHSHRRSDFIINGIRFVNNPLGYPHEREKNFIPNPQLPLKIWGKKDFGEI